MGMTERERLALDEAYHKKAIGETLTSDEIDMIIAFERNAAIREVEEQAKLEAFEAQAQAEIEENRKTARMMREVLLDKCNAEKEKYFKLVSDDAQEK